MVPLLAVLKAAVIACAGFAGEVKSCFTHRAVYLPHFLKWFVFHEVRLTLFGFNLTDGIISSTRKEGLFYVALLYVLSHGALMHIWGWLRVAVLKTSRKTRASGLRKTNQDGNTDQIRTQHVLECLDWFYRLYVKSVHTADTIGDLLLTVFAFRVCLKLTPKRVDSLSRVLF